jgi:hypothetical protein
MMQDITDNLCMILIVMICYAGALQKDRVRQVIFSLFGGVMLLQWMSCLVIDPDKYYAYYLIDCVALLFVMEVIAKTKPFTKACLYMQYLCGFGVCLNIAGAVLFYANIDHAVLYSLIYVGIYIVTFLIMINGSLNAGTDNGVLSIGSGLSRIVDACRVSNQAGNGGA